MVVLVHGGPHQEAEPGGQQEATHSHCPSLLLDRQREDQGKYKTKTRSATSYTEPNKLPTFVNIIACHFNLVLNMPLKYLPRRPVIHVPIYQ